MLKCLSNWGFKGFCVCCVGKHYIVAIATVKWLAQLADAALLICKKGGVKWFFVMGCWCGCMLFGWPAQQVCGVRVSYVPKLGPDVKPELLVILDPSQWVALQYVP